MKLTASIVYPMLNLHIPIPNAVFLIICITKVKVRKKLIKLIHMENLHKSIFSLVLDSNNPIPQKTIMNNPIVLQLSPVVGN